MLFHIILRAQISLESPARLTSLKCPAKVRYATKIQLTFKCKVFLLVNNFQAREGDMQFVQHYPSIC